MYYHSNIFCFCRIATYIDLPTIVGAFAVGMTVASIKLIKQVEEYAHRLQLIFAFLFFAIIGAQVNKRHKLQCTSFCDNNCGHICVI